ncbi:hypothetical protein HCN44_005375 [Aphidius gifuensis]|uniref:Cell growth-regulating nucleolar protein n=1 Tax=Aphidius gifuensis TaxID=684658 RepID=A0A835CX44_APHGI|nr:cell growth-regulating nucleolar protein [Aphidius gifuensis]KAF7997098.1 hypothetical protein HCN44_005375 [Aphidius gifuensis]
MVVFTCNHCGDSLQKPKVAKHYQFQCRSRSLGISLTCVDCFKDFFGDQYDEHTKCITEAERYGGKNFQAKANKGEKKQQEWINVVKNVLESETNLSRDEKQMLQSLSKHDNIPRKKAKYLNFVKNVMGYRVNMNVVDSCWVKMEAAFKGPAENKTSEAQVTNGKSTKEEITIIENENNENISQEKCDLIVEDKDNEKKKKKKKRVLENTEVKNDEVDEPAAKRQCQKQSDDNQAVESNEIKKFNWKKNILEVIENKEEMSLKKLKKKVIEKYLNHVENSVDKEKAISRFDKKINKITNLVVDNNKVKLVKC